MKIGKLPKAQENAGNQVTIGFRLASDWFKAWHDFSGPITDRSKAITDYFRCLIECQSIILFP